MADTAITGEPRQEPGQSETRSWFESCRAQAPRYVKSAVGVAIVAYAGMASLRAFVLPVSTAAVVAGSLTTLRAPIDGLLDLRDVALGAAVKPKTELASISNPWVDDSMVLELKNRVASARAELDALGPQEAALDELATRLQKGASVYQTQRSLQLGSLLAEAEAKLEAERAEDALSRDRLARAQVMVSEGISSTEHLEQAARDREVAARRFEATQKSIDSIALQRKAAQLGINIDASGMGADRPYSRQRLDEVTMERIRVKQRIVSQSQLRDAVAAQLANAEARVTRMAHVSLTSAKVGRVWKMFAAEQAYVTRGQPILSIVDCDSPLVVASVKERIFRKLRVGSPIQFTIDGRSLAGSVVQLDGLARPSQDDVVVAPGLIGQRDPIPTSADPYRVTMSVPELARSQSGECNLGRSGDVTFE